MESSTTPSTALVSPAICTRCEEHVFTTSNFGLAWKDLLKNLQSRFSYTTTWGHVQSSASSGCTWCGVIISLCEPDDDKAKKPWISVEVRLRKNEGQARPKGVEQLSVWIDAYPRGSFYVYADSGMYYSYNSSKSSDLC